MRTFETLIILFNLFSLLIWLIPLFRLHWLPVFNTGAMFSTLVHLGIEGYRWQMVPLYGITAVLFLLSLRRVWYSIAAARPPWIYPTLGLIGLLFAGLPPVLLPVPQPLEPTGPFPVGTTSFEWIDESRTEIYAPVPGGPRRIMVQVWYPAEPGPQAERAPYLERIELAAGAIAENFDLPSFLLGHLRLAHTNAYSNVPPASQISRFPVLLFSHGWTGMRVQNTYQMEELASHGYVVFSPDHTYGSVVTIFPNEEIVFANLNALPPRGTPPEEYDPVARRLGETWVGDLLFVLNQAQRMDAGEIDLLLAGRLNLDQVGVLGHSTGGGAAVEFCWIEQRCRAGIAMDAWLIPYDRSMLSEGIDKPMLLMQSEAWQANRNLPLVDTLYANLPEGRLRMTLLNTAHYDFTDIPQLTALGRFIGLSGSGASKKTLRVINDFSVAYFDRYLKGNLGVDIERLAQLYPQVRIEE
jgi:pimeloyl-ACP methyl ester carboxylesterase